jgi:hypothetical protein
VTRQIKQTGPFRSSLRFPNPGMWLVLRIAGDPNATTWPCSGLLAEVPPFRSLYRIPHEERRYRRLSPTTFKLTRHSEAEPAIPRSRNRR